MARRFGDAARAQAVSAEVKLPVDRVVDGAWFLYVFLTEDLHQSAADIEVRFVMLSATLNPSRRGTIRDAISCRPAAHDPIKKSASMNSPYLGPHSIFVSFSSALKCAGSLALKASKIFTTI